MDINFYNVDLKYIEFIKSFEEKHRGFTRVPNVNYHSHNNKFFYGTVLHINNMNYFVPVSSNTKSKQDDINIVVKDKINPNYGTLRFAYMIPIPNECLSLLVRDTINNPTQRERIRKELAFCRKNKDRINKQALKTYNRVNDHISVQLSHNSCDFKLLEQAYISYCKENNLEYSGDEQTIEELTKNCSEWADKVIEKIERNRKAREDDNTIR